MGVFEIVLIILCVVVVVGVFAKWLYNFKKGKPSCSCGCKNCPSSGLCHKKKDEEENQR